jgi:prepilin-type N-terminal cleavage/methylation domain-containing protein
MRTRIRRLVVNDAGFTLVELLVVMSILGVIVGGLTTTFTAATEAQLDMTRRFEAQQEGRLALDKLRREAHCASAASVTGTSLVTLTFPTTAGTTACPAGTGVANVTWCARAGTNGNELYRIASVSTCTGGVRVAGYLVTTDVFVLFAPAAGSGELAKLRVSFPVDLTPLDASERYSLVDDIALRNTPRA